jgi:drug/metabolite transporter (DMT)-like permease
MTKQPSQNILATISLLFSASMWGVIWYPLRLLDEAGMSAVWSSFVMYMTAAIIAVPFMIKIRFFSQLRSDLIWLAIAAGITNVAFLTAMIEGEVMRVMLLFYLSPIWSVLLGRWWLGETLSPLGIIMFCLAILGSLIMLWDPAIGWPWPQGLGDWLALLGSAAFSINNVLARKLGDTSMTMKVSSLWWGCVIVSLITILLLRLPVPSVSISVWMYAAAMGLFGMISMNIAVLYGLAKMPIYRSAVIMLFELIVAAIAAWWLTNELMTASEWFGGALIVLAGYGVARSEHHANKIAG